MDLSSKDNQYFLTDDTYNCPFCKRNNIVYRILDRSTFDQSNDIQIYFYRTQCSGCYKVSIHFSKTQIPVFDNNTRAPSQRIQENSEYATIDSLFFRHKPNSFFILDDSIPSNIRKLFDEAQSCLDSNFLVGASGCIRKMVYTLLHEENCIIEKDGGLTNYDESFKKLVALHPEVDMLQYSHLITQLMSTNLHEGSKEWKSKEIKFMLGFTKDLLRELYVIPNQKKAKHNSFQKLLSELNANPIAAQSKNTQSQ